MREFKEIKGAHLTTWNGVGRGEGGELNLVLMTISTLLNLNNKFDYNWEKKTRYVQITELLLKLSYYFFEGFMACLEQSVNQLKNC